MSSKNFFIAGVLSLFALAACGPDYDRMEVTAVTTPPMGGTVNFQRIEVIEGTVVTARIEPKNDDNESMHCHVRAADANIIEVTAVVNDRVYAFIGQGVGTTRIEFTAGDEVVAIVDAVVKPQPELTASSVASSAGTNQ